NDELYLLAHTRGMIHLIEPWDHQRNMEVIPQELFPSGVLHLILFDAHLNVMSERLVYIHNQDQAQLLYRTDREKSSHRSLVKSTISVTDLDGNPLEGSFSISVTSNREVMPDSTANIATQLLLASDLRGYIENPVYYFRNTVESSQALDLLMLVNGWRRYDISNVVKGHYAFPELKYSNDGIRETELIPAIVTEDRKIPVRPWRYLPPPRQNTLNEEQLKKSPTYDIYSALHRLPSIRIEEGLVFIGNARMKTFTATSSRVEALPLVLLNDMVIFRLDKFQDKNRTDRITSMFQQAISSINMSDVVHIDVLNGSPTIFGSAGFNGVISIFTRDGNKGGYFSNTTEEPTPSAHIKIASPLGYQQPVEFFSPKTDNGTTIHWQPVVQTNSQGVASFDFYTSDDSESYTVTIQGVTNDGQIIQKYEKISF
ncbi:MAG: TonB-dependent receptor plug domain-containing protein, partial [Prevotellaceae bacterium]|nr:TonB-dependent receptor plug domain-containing protein [Prevotellaceae bacterium]